MRKTGPADGVSSRCGYACWQPSSALSYFWVGGSCAAAGQLRAAGRLLRPLARRCGAGVILCTVPTNIRSCAPFGSEHNAGLTIGNTALWEGAFREGQILELADGNFAGALSAYERARQIDDSPAHLAFCMGRCLEALGRPDEAKDLFIEARDRDVLRFRADSSILRVIRGTAQARAAQGVRLLDLETILESRSQDHLLGSDLLVEHVHLNFRGNFLAACTALQVIREMLPQAGLAEPKGSEEELLDLCPGIYCTTSRSGTGWPWSSFSARWVRQIFMGSRPYSVILSGCEGSPHRPVRGLDTAGILPAVPRGFASLLRS